jgi:hypothetical protein
VRNGPTLALALAAAALASCDATLPWSESPGPARLPAPTASATALFFTAREGDAAPPPQEFELASVPLRAQVYATTDATFGDAEVTPVSSDGTAVVAVTVVPPAQAGVGTWTGTVHVWLCTPDCADATVLQVALTYVVSPRVVVVLPTSLLFRQYVGGPSPADQKLTVGGDPDAGPWEIALEPDAAAEWLSVSPSAGTSTPAEVVVAVVGPPPTSSEVTRQATLVFSRAEAEARVSVARVGVTPRLHVPSEPLHFAAVQGGAPPPPQVLELTTDGGAPVAYSTIVPWQYGVQWVTAPREGVAPGPFSVSIVVTDLPVGSHAVEISIYHFQAHRIPVILEITDPLLGPSTL